MTPDSEAIEGDEWPFMHVHEGNDIECYLNKPMENIAVSDCHHLWCGDIY